MQLTVLCEQSNTAEAKMREKEGRMVALLSINL